MWLCWQRVCATRIGCTPTTSELARNSFPSHQFFARDHWSIIALWEYDCMHFKMYSKWLPLSRFSTSPYSHHLRWSRWIRRVGQIICILHTSEMTANARRLHTSERTFETANACGFIFPFSGKERRLIAIRCRSRSDPRCRVKVICQAYETRAHDNCTVFLVSIRIETKIHRSPNRFLCISNRRTTCFYKFFLLAFIHWATHVRSCCCVTLQPFIVNLRKNNIHNDTDRADVIAERERSCRLSNSTHNRNQFFCHLQSIDAKTMNGAIDYGNGIIEMIMTRVGNSEPMNWIAVASEFSKCQRQ